MSTHDNGAIETPEWQPEPRCCPLPACDICTPPAPTGFGTYPPNVVLGEN